MYSMGLTWLDIAEQKIDELEKQRKEHFINEHHLL